MQAWARRSPAERYHDLDLASRVEGATPHGLVTILYAELGTALDVLARAQDMGDVVRATQQRGRAATILHSLMSGLDLERGGALARSLHDIYFRMQRRLAIAQADRAALAELRAGVINLANAWAKIER